MKSGTRSQTRGIRVGYFSTILAASAFRCSKGVSSYTKSGAEKTCFEKFSTVLLLYWSLLAHENYEPFRAGGARQIMLF